MKPSRLTLIAVLTLLTGADAQQFSIGWHTIDGGGGSSQSGSFAVTGTMGQPDASYYTMTGPKFSITGGFWSIFVVQTPGAPTLKIRFTETNTAIVSWPSASTGYTLQQNATLLYRDWLAPTEPVQDDGTSKYIVTSPSGNRYYRLIKP